MKSVTEAARFVLGTVLRDESWQDLGFAKRPKYGGIAQRFRPLWRVQLEKAVLKQMVAVFTAAHVTAGVLEPEDLPELVEIYVDGPNTAQDLWRSYGYTSRSEAVQHLTSMITEYVEMGPGDWAAILGSRLDVSNLPDKKLAANLLVGVVRFTQAAEDMMPYLRSGEVG